MCEPRPSDQVSGVQPLPLRKRQAIKPRWAAPLRHPTRAPLVKDRSMLERLQPEPPARRRRPPNAAVQLVDAHPHLHGSAHTGLLLRSHACHRINPREPQHKRRQPGARQSAAAYISAAASRNARVSTHRGRRPSQPRSSGRGALAPPPSESLSTACRRLRQLAREQAHPRCHCRRYKHSSNRRSVVRHQETPPRSRGIDPLTDALSPRQRATPAAPSIPLMACYHIRARCAPPR